MNPDEVTWDELNDHLVPFQGEADTVEGELMTAVGNIGYEATNNGLGNIHGGYNGRTRHTVHARFLDDHADRLNPHHPLVDQDLLREFRCYIEGVEAGALERNPNLVDRVTDYIKTAVGRYIKNEILPQIDSLDDIKTACTPFGEDGESAFEDYEGGTLTVESNLSEILSERQKQEGKMYDPTCDYRHLTDEQFETIKDELVDIMTDGDGDESTARMIVGEYDRGHAVKMLAQADRSVLEDLDFDVNPSDETESQTGMEM